LDEGDVTPNVLNQLWVDSVADVHSREGMGDEDPDPFELQDNMHEDVGDWHAGQWEAAQQISAYEQQGLAIRDQNRMWAEDVVSSGQMSDARVSDTEASGIIRGSGKYLPFVAMRRDISQGTRCPWTKAAQPVSR
jgi:hypothetical protein